MNMPRPGRPAEAVTPTMVTNVFVNKDRRVTLQEVANQFSICKVLAHQILHQIVGMSKVSARWVPKQLTEDQKASRVTIAKNIWGCFNHDENKFLNCIVTGDKMWVHYAEPETKGQSNSGNELILHFPWSLSCLHQLARLCFWDSCGIILAHFMQKGQTVTTRYYSEVILKNLKEKLKKLIQG